MRRWLAVAFLAWPAQAQWIEFQACGRAFPEGDFGDLAYIVTHEPAPNIRSFRIRADKILAILEPKQDERVKVKGVDCLELYLTGNVETGFLVQGTIDEVVEKIDKALGDRP